MFAVNFGSTTTDAPMTAPARSSQETEPGTEQAQDPRQKAPPTKKRREPEQWQGRGRGWDKGNKWDSWSSSTQQGDKDLMYAMARLILRREDSLSIAASENGYMLFIKANRPASILPGLFGTPVVA